MNALAVLVQGDLVHAAVALVLLAMSVGSWVVIVWKTWLLRRAAHDVRRCTSAFWQAGDTDTAVAALTAFDRSALVLPLAQAAHAQLRIQRAGQGLGAAGDVASQLTRVLRDALQSSVHKLQSGQVLLATVGAVAPFVGLLGTVWGIYHALLTIASVGQVSIDKIAGPVGESLIMTAAGLAVAIPAVLGYNLLGRLIGRLEAELEGFASDLRALMAAPHSESSASPRDGA
ncbi:MAG: MotA/TolQ/ExbB proton channel family protein [Rhodoferax sp.]